MDNISTDKSITVEGPDQVGKGDTVKNIAQELSNLGISVVVINLPYYATPVGEIINTVLHNGFDEDLKIEIDRQVLIKMALFSLNRLEILNCILANRGESVYVFDRGPFSHALTIAYYLTQGGTDSEIEKLVSIGLDLDAYFRNILNIDNCVIKLRIADTEWSFNREGEGDVHESIDVQGKCEEVYLLMEEVIGKGWINITTKERGKWRARSDIAEECLSFICPRLSFPNSPGIDEPNTPIYLSIEDIQAYLYGGSRVDPSLREDWLTSIKENDKGGIYGCAGDISEALASTIKEITWYNEDIRGIVKSILEEYPEILYLLEKRFGEVFVLKLLTSVYD